MIEPGIPASEPARLAALRALEVLDTLPEDRFDLVLMDVQMPDMDGLETTRRIRSVEASAGLPVVALTASAFEQDRKECMDAGFTDFLTKPIRLPDLEKAILKHPAGSR